MFLREKRFVAFANTIACTMAVWLSWPSTSAGQQRQDVRYITSDAVVAVIVEPKSLLAKPEMELMPREILAVALSQATGIELAEVERVTAFAGLPTGPAGPELGVVLKTSKRQTISGDAIAQTNDGTIEGKPYRKALEPTQLSYFIVDDNTVLIGSDPLLQRMTAEDGRSSSPLIDMLKGVDASSHVNAFLAMAPLREMLKMQLEMAPVPEPFQPLKQLPQHIESIELHANLAGDLQTRLVIHAAGDESVRELSRLIDYGIDMGKQVALAEILRNTGDSDDPMDAATRQYFIRVADSVQKLLSPKVENRRLTVELAGKDATIGILTALLLPAVQSARGAARRVQSLNNMRQILIAFHLYHDAKGSLPSRAIFDDDGKPLLSWRVHILPYVEQEPLYREFHLDEPWDSPHNIKLINKIPDVYRNPNLPGSTTTNYLVPVGEETLFSGKEGTKFSQVLDGTSNTIMLIEADEDQAVPWTKPADWNYDADEEIQGIGNLRNGTVQLGIADGSVQTESATDIQRIRDMLTKDGGERIDF